MAPPTKTQASSESHHVVVVGSGGVGKSCLTIRFLKDEFSNEYDPTIGTHTALIVLWGVEENYRKNITVDSTAVILNIVDTAGQVRPHRRA
jgi:GTPase KRas protein